MRFGYKYLYPPLLTLFWFLLGGAIVLICDIATSLGYSFLCEALPELFTRPTPISEAEEYERMLTSLAMWTLTLTTLIVTYFSMRLDNKRFEHLIVLTEGLYSIPERTLWHLRSFWLSDIIAASLAPALLTFPVYIIPEPYIDFLSPIFWCGERLAPHFELWRALVISIGTSLLARLILLPSVLRAWRASWLSGSID